MSFWKKKDKPKDKDEPKTDVKVSKVKKPKVRDIWEACEQGSVEGLERLIKKKNGVAQINQPNEEGRWPIHVAVGAGNVPFVEVLLANGAQCNMIESTEARWNVLHWAVASRSFEMMKLIVSQPGLKPDFRGPSSGSSRMDRNTALHHFSRMYEEDPEDIITLIIQKGGNVNSVNSQGDTPLHVACAEKHVAIVKSLLAHGANPNAQNDHGETPLHFGALYGPDVIVKVLLKYGASPTVFGAHGTPYDVAVSATAKRLLAPPPSAPAQSSGVTSPAATTGTSTPALTNGASNDANTLSSGSTTNSTASITTSHPGTIEHNASAAALQRMVSKKYHWLVEFNEILLGPQIGSGGFGVVYRGVWRGIDVAVKCLKPEADVTEESLSVFMHEVNIMSKLRHQNILLFVGACLTQPNICFLTEFIPHGNLRQVLDKERLQPIKKLNMSLEATRGLTYLHAQLPSVLHRDLKTTNVLVDDNYHIKLADFGLSRPMAHHTTTTNGPKMSTESPTASTASTDSTTSQTSNGTEKNEATENSTGSTHHHHHSNGQDHKPNTPDAAMPTTEVPPSEAPTEAKEESIKLTITSAVPVEQVPSSGPEPSASASSLHTGVSYLDAIEQAGTLYSTPPEVLNGYDYTKESDVYALGIIFWELATEKMPFEGLNNLQVLRTIIEESLPIPTEMGSLYGQLVQDMLSKDPSKRPTLSQITERLKAVRTQLGEMR